jgi:hypothetical protein
MGREASVRFSIEAALTGLWQQALWEGWSLSKEAENWRYAPNDRPLLALRHAWLSRQQSNLMRFAQLDFLVDRRLREQGSGKIESTLALTVTGAVYRGSGKTTFQIGSSNLVDHLRLRHIGDAAVLEASYLESFMDTPLDTVGLSSRELSHVWWIVRDAAFALSKTLAAKTPIDALARWSLQVERTALAETVERCSKHDANVIDQALTFLTYDSSRRDTFRKGLWAHPLLPVGDDKIALSLPSLIAGSPVRRVEIWLEQSGKGNKLVGSRRGTRYEATVRASISEAISKNPLLPESRCAPDALRPLAADVGDIDLLIWLAPLLLVAEVKCKLTPTEPIERYNYGRMLQEAANQARRKAHWVEHNIPQAAAALDVSPDTIISAEVVPLIVVNQGYGFSLEIDGCRVIDELFLRNYFADGALVTGSAFGKGGPEMGLRFRQVLYQSAAEASARLPEHFAEPFVLKRFLDKIEWRTVRFPTASGAELLIEAVGMTPDPVLNDDERRAIKASFPGKASLAASCRRA